MVREKSLNCSFKKYNGASVARLPAPRNPRGADRNPYTLPPKFMAREWE
jgi:hypothetical protein